MVQMGANSIDQTDWFDDSMFPNLSEEWFVLELLLVFPFQYYRGLVVRREKPIDSLL